MSEGRADCELANGELRSANAENTSPFKLQHSKFNIFPDAKLGFVPRADNTAIAQMLDNGEQLATRIVHLEQSKNPWVRIRFEVALNG